MTRHQLGELIKALFRASPLPDVCEAPVSALQAADASSFGRVKEHLPQQITPSEALFSVGQDPEEWSVWAIAFPRKLSIVTDNSREKGRPSSSWMTSKALKTTALPQIGQDLRGSLNDEGVDAFVGTDLLKSCGEGIWSERHIGYGTGLGTFGLNGALITEVGATVRLLSLLLKQRFARYDEVASDPFANCLWHTTGTCGVCIRRCPVDAIDAEGHHPEICRERAYAENSQYSKEHHGVEIGGCALCMCGVPCSRKNPVRN